MKRLIVFIMLFGPFLLTNGQTLEEVFKNPPMEARPLMIWQWMDGLVTKEGITADLEAYREAGLGGVQQFQVGGPMQGIIRDTTNAIGTENWQKLMRHAMSECGRLGLSFGTHNCPGWSSSAYPAVTPEYSMQRLVWRSITVCPSKEDKILLPEQPEIDRDWNYYKDIAVLVMPDDSIVRLQDIHVYDAKDFPLSVSVGNIQLRIIRFGHTTTGKTNEATAPYGGVGLECDKMSREAVSYFWKSYPKMLLEIGRDALGENIGNVFQRLDIDSYEADGQDWTPEMPDEFKMRRGYELLPWLPVIAGITIESKERSQQFWNDFVETGTDLFAENYYAYMSALIHETKGMRLIYEPYRTGKTNPYNPLDIEKIVGRLPNDIICTEFWTHPDNWGWPSVPRHMKTAHQHGLQEIYAEAFTCWPLSAWQDDPASLKPMADKAFALGVNRLMLHAGAHNPWPKAVPGMTFGKWGTQWTPQLTWWRSGGAKQLFMYFSRCQALLQRGEWVDDYKSGQPSLTGDANELEWTHRKDVDVEIYFIANPLDSAFTCTFDVHIAGLQPELWMPETGARIEAPEWKLINGKTRITLHLDEHQSLFVVLRHRTKEEEAGAALQESHTEEKDFSGTWELHFPDGWGAPACITLNNLIPWNEHSDAGVRYFSGTATYAKTFQLNHFDKNARYVLHLGIVKNLAQVTLNGHPVAHLWKKPFRCDVSSYIKEGDNRLEIAVTNLWPNRMIGDEQWPDDIEWSEPYSYDYAPGKPVVGRFMKSVPEWLHHGMSRPSPNRKTVVSFKFFEKDTPLLPSGLLGPVVLEVIK